MNYCRAYCRASLCLPGAPENSGGQGWVGAKMPREDREDKAMQYAMYIDDDDDDAYYDD